MNSDLIRQRAHRIVSVSEFRESGMPEAVGNISLNCPYDEQYILRMAIRADGGPFQIPDELRWLQEIIDLSVISQQTIAIDHPFCYVTVRHGRVKTVTDDQWHVDGFSTKIPHVPEQNYVWASHTGTQCAELAVRFPKDFDPLRHNVNTYLTQFIDRKKITSLEPGVVYVMDPYMLHRRPPQTSNTYRTFVRVTHVPIQINDIKNTPNPLLPIACDTDGVAYRNMLENYPQ